MMTKQELKKILSILVWFLTFGFVVVAKGMFDAAVIFAVGFLVDYSIGKKLKE